MASHLALRVVSRVFNQELEHGRCGIEVHDPCRVN